MMEKLKTVEDAASGVICRVQARNMRGDLESRMASKRSEAALDRCEAGAQDCESRTLRRL
jgi:hypothetical protein